MATLIVFSVCIVIEWLRQLFFAKVQWLFQEMKILFFSPVNSSKSTPHNGGGWIWALVQKLLVYPGMELAVSFEGNGVQGECINGIIHYPVSVSGSLKRHLIRKLSPDFEVQLLLPEMQKVIKKFQPDVIYIFGSENAFGEICGHTSIPCIIHLQGFLPSCYNAKFPPGVSLRDFSCNFFLHPLQTARFLWFDRIFRYRAKRELAIVQKCRSFFGRTDWDKSIVRLFNPEATYFYCSEMLRQDFYAAAGEWKVQTRETVTLISVLSSPLYKGHDLILKTAQILTQYTKLNFQWKVFGGDFFDFWEKKLRIVPETVHVIRSGIASAQQLKGELLTADLYIHPSYIDNSPNSVCEAQLLGLPIIAVNAGGVASLVEHRQSGILVPANDPAALADWILQLLHNNALRQQLGTCAANTAQARHNPDTIVDQVLNACRQLCAKNIG